MQVAQNILGTIIQALFLLCWMVNILSFSVGADRLDDETDTEIFGEGIREDKIEKRSRQHLSSSIEDLMNLQRREKQFMGYISEVLGKSKTTDKLKVC